MGKRPNLGGEAALHLGALLPFLPVRKKQHVSIQCILKQTKIAVEVEAMIDSGATSLFIDKEFAKKIGLKLFPKKSPIPLTLFDGSPAEDITHQAFAELHLGKQVQKLRFDVTTLSHFAIIFGLPGLRTYNPHIDWANEVIEITEDSELALKGTAIAENPEETVPEELHEYVTKLAPQPVSAPAQRTLRPRRT